MLKEQAREFVRPLDCGAEFLKLQQDYPEIIAEAKRTKEAAEAAAERKRKAQKDYDMLRDRHETYRSILVALEDGTLVVETNMHGQPLEPHTFGRLAGDGIRRMITLLQPGDFDRFAVLANGPGVWRTRGGLTKARRWWRTLNAVHLASANSALAPRL